MIRMTVAAVVAVALVFAIGAEAGERDEWREEGDHNQPLSEREHSHD